MAGVVIFNIQKYSLHDGTGIRTTIFLKGCPLRCRWCCNPESQSSAPETMYRRTRCIGCEKCGLCAEADSGITFDEEGIAVMNPPRVGEAAIGVCPTGAIHTVGRIADIEELLDTVERDAAFYRSGGGMTLSGGEPLMQEAAVTLLSEARRRHINTAIETCGYVDTDRLLAAAEFLDEIFYDMKSLDDERHLEYTGVTNERIRDNLRVLCEAYPSLKKTVRTPVIPGFNDDEASLEQIESFVSGLSGAGWQRLPYHTYGAGKYEMLGREYPMK